ncbi:hypothetical protein Misp01_42920 [Microtetraspora sp. NBRC 13810]|nr:hypothetical protein Misp01_42920 [Microtetraspora sp. NBRC 13810]
MKLSARLQTVRKRRGLTQKELADLAGVSVSLVRKIEQGVVQDTRLETVRRFATALRIPTTQLVGPRPDDQEQPAGREIWEPTKRALIGQVEQPSEPPTAEGVRAGFEALKPLLAANKYAEIASLLPLLLRDADALSGDGRAVRSRLLNMTGWILTQTRQYGAAEPTLQLALDTADNRLDAGAAVNTLGWLHLRRGLLDDARELTVRWADELEPRFSRATTAELSVWGRLLLNVSAAAIRDNREGEAEDTIRLARSAAVRIGHETLSDASTTRTFGPVTVAMIHAEHSTVQDKPDKVLAIAARVPTTLLHGQSASRNRHRLDVANALVSTRQRSEALGVLTDLSQSSPEWIASQRYAKDILGRVINRRRTLTDEMRSLADTIGMAY